MPGGLQEVVQPVGADASKYISEYRAALAVTRELSAANQDLMRSVAEAQSVIRGSGGAAGGIGGDPADIARTNSAIRETLASLREVQPTMEAAQAAGRDYAQVVQILGTTHTDAATLIRATTAAVGEQASALRDQVTVVKASADATADHAVAAISMADAQWAANDAAKALMMNHLQETNVLRDGTATVRAYEGSLGSLRDTAGGTASALAGAAAAIAAASGGGAGGGGGLADARAQLAGIESGLTAMLASGPGGGRPGSSGGTGGYDAAISAAIAKGMVGGGGSGAGGGGIGGFWGGLTGGLGGGGNDAAGQWDSVAGWMSTWYPRFHWAMMATNEFLATAGPAAVAAGAAGFVGLQGAQEMYGRIAAVNAVGQSLGPSLGQTPGSILGVGTSLQTAQNQANASVWELEGAAKNSANATAGTDFWQLGTNTIDMVDRFAAKITEDFQNGLGGKLDGVVQQGTSDLQQFGDVAGNIGKTFLNVVPSLPGVGGDLLTTLNAATKGLADTAGVLGETGLLGPLLSFEAASRYGPTLVGAAGAGIGRLGTALTGTGIGGPVGGLGSILGTSAHAATAEEAAVSGGVIAEGDMVGGAGIAGALGGMTAIPIGALGATAYLGGKLLTSKSPSQSYVGGITGPVGEAPVGYQGFTAVTNAMKSLQDTMPQALSTAAGVSSVLSTLSGGANLTQFGVGSALGGAVSIREPGTKFGAGAEAASQIMGTSGVSSAYSQGLGQLAGYMNDSFKAGSQIAQMFHVSLPEAFALTAQSGLQLGSAFGKDGMLNATSIEQVLNMKAGYDAMNASQGVLAKDIGGVQVASGLAGTQIQNVNTALDQFTQNATSGEGGATGLAASIAGAKSLGGASQIAQALTGFSSTASQGAWSAFSSNSTSAPGMIQQLGSLQDSLRLAQTSGVLSQPDVTAAAMFQAKQILPYAKDSPAALANLSISAQEAGFGGFAPGATQAQNFADLTKFVDKHAATAKQDTDILNKQAEGMSNVSQQASGFGQTMNNDVYNAMAKAASIVPQATANMKDFADSLNMRGAGTFSGSALQSTVKDLTQMGANLPSIKTLMAQVESQHGITGAAAQHLQLRVTADVSAAQAAINGVHGKNVNINLTAAGAAAAQQAIDSVHGKNVTVNVDEVYSVTDNVVTNDITHQVSPYTPAGAAANLLPAAYTNLHGQTGMRIPGYGGGDIYPAMLEPGEAVVPKHLVGALAPFLGAHGVPGFASGGVAGTVPNLPYAQYEQLRAQWEKYKTQMQSEHKWYDSFDQWYTATQGKSSSATTGGGGGGIASYIPLPGSAGGPPQLPIPAAASKALDALLAELAKSGAWKQAGVNVINGITYSLSGPANAAKVGAALVKTSSADAAALVSKFQTAMNYARSTAASTVSGLGLSSMDVTPGTGNGTIQEQMQSYLGSIQSFTGDLKTLSKDGLNKALIQQLVAAGPVQGDALSQSILGSYGGVGMTNSLWKQIGTASNALGARAGMAVYGGTTIAPDLKSGTVTSNNVTVNVTAPGGAGQDLNLTSAQIKTLTEMIQAKLLQQARRNPKTGLTLAGKNS